MKAFTGVLVIFLAASTGLAQDARTQGPSRNQGPDYYPIKVGTKWHYQVGVGSAQKVTITYQIAKIENLDGKPSAVVEQSVNGEIQTSEHIGVERGGVYRYRFSVISGQKAAVNEISPPVCILKYPVKEGSAWEAESKIGANPVNVMGREGAPEEVQVPAGKYMAVPVKIETTIKGTKVTNTYWFAPDVGIVKQTAEIMPKQTYTMELSKFEPAS